MLQEVNPSIESHGGRPSNDSESVPSLQTVNPSMDAPSTISSILDDAISEEEMVERIEAVVEQMTEMFGTYFKASTIATKLDNLEGTVMQRVLRDSIQSPERGMRSLLESLTEKGGKPLLDFYTLIKTMDSDSGCLPMPLLSSLGNLKKEEISRLMQFIVELVEQRNLGKLKHSDLQDIVNRMMNLELMKKPKENLEKMADTAQGFLHLLSLFRKSDPDWPFSLWTALQNVRPDLFMQAAAIDECNSSCTDGSYLSASSSDGLILENPSPPLSECSSIPASRSRYKPGKLQQFHVTPKDQEFFDHLLNIGSLDQNQVTADEFVSASRRDAWNDTGEESAEFSDGDNEETERKVPYDGTSDFDEDLNLRNYQKELSEDALKGKNTIICARTGCGKTRVAMHIIIKHLRGSAEDKFTSRKVCFFARTVPLAVQQYKTIKKRLPENYKINIFTGDSENSTDMHLLLDKFHVVVVTPMILQNHITRGKVPGLQKFSLLVFDECHHTREKEPYNTLMASYVNKKLMGTAYLPQVIGLTASFPVEKAQNAPDAARSILQLCANLDAHSISTVEKYKEEYDKLVPVPTEEIEQLRERDDDESYKKIIAVMEKLEAEAQDCAKDIGDFNICQILSATPSDNRKLQKYNNWTVELLNRTQEIPLSLKETNMSVRLLMIIAQYLTKYHFALETHDLVHLQDVINYLDDCFTENKFDEFETSGETRLYDYFNELKANVVNMCHEDNPNLRRLVDVIKEKMLKAGTGSSSRGIIFVRTRAIAEALALWLNRCEDQEIVKLKANIFTGTNAKESQGGMTQSQQNALVDQFKEGKVRLLVATSVAEEGMDVPECNLVIKYNHVGNEITTIQTRGRSRKVGGHSVLLAMGRICEKEMINQERTQLMYEGIEIVRKMSEEDFIDAVVRNQIAAKQKRDLEELIASENERKYRDKKFRMICKLCRTFFIESDSLRTLCRNHRIVVDKDVWDNKRIIKTDVKYVNEIKIIGSVRCKSDVEGTKCHGPLGAMVSFNGSYFLAVGIKNFTFDEENRNLPKAVKKWKDLPYTLKELSNEDIMNYILQKKEVGPGIQETEPVSDSHLTSYATTIAQESTSSEDLNEIYKRYEKPSSQVGTSLVSSYSSSNTHHETQPKEVVMSEYDSGLVVEDES